MYFKVFNVTILTLKIIEWILKFTVEGLELSFNISWEDFQWLEWNKFNLRLRWFLVITAREFNMFGIFLYKHKTNLTIVFVSF